MEQTAKSASMTYPVRVLREHISGLETAISVCLADANHKPVHKLRTQTRRVEALLLLLALVPALPEHRKQAAALLRALGKLRRAAGKVRDLDVHRAMLQAFAQAQADAQAAGGTAETDSTPSHPATDADQDPRPKPVVAKAGAGSDAADLPGRPPAANARLLSRSAAELRKRLGTTRDKAAPALQDLLRKRLRKTTKAAEALLTALEPATDLALPAPDLLRDAQTVLTGNGLLESRDAAKLGKDDLHTLRKSAKAARYIAESHPLDPALADAAQRFEALQEAGGQWHDALELARAARQHFGKGHELTVAYRKERDRKLDAYRRLLTSLPQGAVPQTKRPPTSTNGVVAGTRLANKRHAA